VKHYAKTNTINYEIIFSIAQAFVIVFVSALGFAIQICDETREPYFTTISK